MTVYKIDFRPQDISEFKEICLSMTTSGLILAKAKYGNHDDDIKVLRGKWEGYHLVTYGTYCKKKLQTIEL
jgi:hypothetical protein